MKRLVGLTLGLMTVMAVSASAQGHRGDRYGRDPYNGGRDPYYGRDDGYASGSYRPYGNSGSLIARVQSDLSRAAANSYTDGHERGHFNTAQRALSDFQARWSQGRFDRGRLDTAIASLNDLAKSDQVHPRDRSILANDLAALRQFRANPQAGSYGGYGQSYPYGSQGPYERH